jgi:predicted Zn-dependent protease
MRKTLIVIAMFLCAVNLSAMNPVAPVFNYFSNLLDETRAELVVGELMSKEFLANVSKNVKVELSPTLSKQMKKLSLKSGRKNLNYEVYVINSDIPDEIPFPGGILFVTKGLLAYAKTSEQLDFILARNVMHMVLKNPMRLVKRVGIYPVLLNQLKLPAEKREKSKILAALRDYLGNTGKLEHIKADEEALTLTDNPEKTREAAIAMISQFSVNVWPVMPLETVDIPDRINKLKELKLNR